MKVVVLVAGGQEMLPHRVSCALAITDLVYVADVSGVRRYEPDVYYGDTPDGDARYRWSLQLARNMYDLAVAGDRVFLFGFTPGPWATSLAVFGREVIEIRCGRSEKRELGKLERFHRQEAMFG